MQINKVQKVVTFLLFTIIIFFAGCAKHELITPASTIKPDCDTSQVSYSNFVQPVLKKYCYACHSGSAAINGYDFSDFNLVYQLATDTAHYIPAVMYRPDLRMPPAPNQTVDSCSIQKIMAWVKRGAPNN